MVSPRFIGVLFISYDSCVAAAYKCACAPGYSLVDGKRCSASVEAAPQLLLAHEKAVLRMDLHGRAPAPLANATQAAGLDFHYKKNLLFWSDLKTRKVSQQYITLGINGLFINARELCSSVKFVQVLRAAYRMREHR